MKDKKIKCLSFDIIQDYNFNYVCVEKINEIIKKLNQNQKGGAE